MVGWSISGVGVLLEVVSRVCVDSRIVVTEIEKQYRKKGAMTRLVDLGFLLLIAVLITKKTYVD